MSQYHMSQYQWVASIALSPTCRPYQHDLMVKRGKSQVSVATVYYNGVWYTWDTYGIGGENSKEDTAEHAKIEAEAAAIAQGFI